MTQATSSTATSPLTRPVRIGLVGYGFGGSTFHAPLITSAPSLELVAVLTSDPARVARLATDHPGVPALPTLEALVEAGAEAVAISSPSGTHSAMTERALELGLHVVCDKPFAVEAPAAAVTIEKAEALRRVVSVYQNRRWDSDFLTVRRLLAAGDLGEEIHMPDT